MIKVILLLYILNASTPLSNRIMITVWVLTAVLCTIQLIAAIIKEIKS